MLEGHEELIQKFDEDYIKKFKAMQEERIAKEHERDEILIEQQLLDEKRRASLRANTSKVVDDLYREHLYLVKTIYQPMHDKLIKMGASCPTCTRNHYDYD